MPLPNISSKDLLARLDRIPVWPYSYWILIMIGAGFFFAFFDIVSIGLALPVFVKQFHISLDMGIWAITSSLMGYILGSLLDSVLSDFFGRRLALILSILFFSLGSLLSATSPDIYWLIFWRFLIGMGIGAEIANVSTYISELSPARCRGRMNSLAISFGFMGFAFVPFIGFLIIPVFTWGWRLLFIIGGLAGFLILISRKFIPETIRWKINQNHLQEAEILLIQAEKIAQERCQKKFKKDLSDFKIQEPMFNNPANNPANNSANKTSSFLNTLLTPALLGRIALFSIIWLVYYIGNYGWLTLNTKLFSLEGFDLSDSILLVALSSLGFISGALIAIFLGDKIQRKYLLAVTALIWALCLSIISWAPYLSIILILGFIASASIALFIPQMYTYTTEIFPTACRATGVSITDGLGHLGGAFCGQIIFGVMALFPSHLNFSIAFSLMGITGLITGILLIFGPRMTKEKLLT